MSALPGVKIHGRLVLAMFVGHGNSDRIEHTLRHFLEPQEFWERIPPDDAAPPATFLEQIRVAGWNLTGASTYSDGEERRINDLSWWREPRLRVVERAHDTGYWPRYLHLVEEAGSLDVSGTRWVPGQRGRCRADVRGCITIVEPRRKGALLVVTSFRDIKDKGFKGSLGNDLSEKLKAWCQARQSAASLVSKEGAVK